MGGIVGSGAWLISGRGARLPEGRDIIVMIWENVVML